MRFGLGVPRGRRTFMGNGSGVSRGDRNRNARLERLRALVPVTNAIVGTGLAGKKQMVVVTVSCEPAGHRWRALSQLAADRAGAVRVRAAGGDLVGPAHRGSDLR